jgi:hypothetical protein
MSLRHRAHHALGVRARCPVLAREPVGVRAARVVDRRQRRVELERAPDDLDGVALGEARERGLEPPFADPSPRAGDVGPHVDAQGLHAAP